MGFSGIKFGGNRTHFDSGVDLIYVSENCALKQYCQQKDLPWIIPNLLQVDRYLRG